MNTEEWKKNRLGYDVVAAFERRGGSGAVRMMLMLGCRASSR